MSKNTKLGWSFTSPYLIFTLIFFLLPLFWSFWLALTSWNMISPTVEFVGFQNFIDAIKSPAIQSAFVVTYKFLIIFVPMALVLSMVIALLVNSLPKLKGLYMVAFFLPYLSSGVVTSLIVKGLLSYNGPFNTFLRTRLGWDIDWLGNPHAAIIIVSPMLYPAFFTVTVLAVGISFGIFTEVYQLTGGGPNFATNTWQMEIYNQAFVNLKSGYASAVALMASVVTFASIGVIRKLLEKWGEKNGWQ